MNNIPFAIPDLVGNGKFGLVCHKKFSYVSHEGKWHHYKTIPELGMVFLL